MRDKIGERFTMRNKIVFFHSLDIISKIKSRRFRRRACNQNERMQEYFKNVNNAVRRHLGNSRFRAENNMKMDPKQIGVNARSQFDSAHDRDYWKAFVHLELNLQIPQIMGLLSYLTEFLFIILCLYIQLCFLQYILLHVFIEMNEEKKK